MKFHKIFSLILIGILFSSCDDSINGNVKDNFGQPIENLTISIPNSDFSAKTDENGDFNIDYVAGQFKVLFEKDGYLPFEKVLNISEQKAYPLGKMETFKLPENEGLHLIEENGYLELNRTKLPYKSTSTRSMFGKISTFNYQFPEDSVITKIKLDSIKIKTLKFFDNHPRTTHLVKAAANGQLLKFTNSIFITEGGKSRALYIKDEETRIAKGIRILEFEPQELNENYAFIEISSDGMSEKMTGYAFCFQVDSLSVL